jgi:lysophospholipase L1-like esterase
VTGTVPSRPGAAALIALAAIGIVLALGIGEAALRVGGFRYETFPMVQFGWPEPTDIQNRYRPDRDLFWVTRDYAEKLAAARATPPAVIFMGDSCTEFANWPQYTIERLTTIEPELAHGVSLAVAGWSSEQGLRQLRRDILSLHPRVAMIYYGWNDHWVPFGERDADLHPNAMTFWLTQHSRLMQLFVKARLGTTARSSAHGSYRVPPDQYRVNLETMGRLARAAGIRAVFITAPTSHERGHEPAYLARRHLRRLDELVPLHAHYVQLTRDAGAASGAEVCDAAAEMAKLPGPIAQYFGGDGIHFNDRGSRALSAIVASCLAPGARVAQPN